MDFSSYLVSMYIPTNSLYSYKLLFLCSDDIISLEQNGWWLGKPAIFSDDLIDVTKSLEVRKAGDRSSRTITVL